MTTYSLTRLGGLANSAKTYVVLAGANKLQPKPMIPLAGDHDHHHDESMPLPNSFQPSTAYSFKNSLIGGSLRVVSPFTSKLFNSN